jgi:hypothetical protein
MSPLAKPTIDISVVDVSLVISGLSKIIGDKEVESDADAAAVIVKSIRNDSDNKRYAVFGSTVVTQTEGFIYLVKNQKTFTLGDEQVGLLGGCPVQK